MSVKELKALFCSLSDDAMVDIWLQDANGGGIAIGGIAAQDEMSTSRGFVVLLPDGYYLTTTNPVGAPTK